MAKPTAKKRVRALKVHQWLKAWDGVDYNPNAHRKKPKPFFYLFAMQAAELRSLCGISRRSSKGVRPRVVDLGIQRQHDSERSDEIARFVEYGYPWSTLSEAKRTSDSFNDLRKPGWLPTAVVINILAEGQERNGENLTPSDVVDVEDVGTGADLLLPYSKWSRDWAPSVPPFEVIDGQHRLWAFGPQESDVNFEVPVVAFHDLDISWQAYLFWTINIKPKRINASLAFDLYPLLRGEDWLERAEEHVVYRDARSQELTEVLWSYSKSPWFDKINMLGERGSRWVTQASWIRSLNATFVRAWSRRSGGGLFGTRVGQDGEVEVLPWNRVQQAAFLIFAWTLFRDHVAQSKSEWAEALRVESREESSSGITGDPAFYGPESLISTDQGVRGFLHVINDLCFRKASQLKLGGWTAKADVASAGDDLVTFTLESIKPQPVAKFLDRAAAGLASFDWRTANSRSLAKDPELRRAKLVFRGSGGYSELRRQMLEHLEQFQNDVGDAARSLSVKLREQ